MEAFDEDIGSDDFIGSQSIDLLRVCELGIRDEWFELQVISTRSKAAFCFLF